MARDDELPGELPDELPMRPSRSRVPRVSRASLPVLLPVLDVPLTLVMNRSMRSFRSRRSRAVTVSPRRALTRR
ncbi:MAG: hypothetical protein EXQ50_02620 [Acidobacteria bacterium]|nr:hypothetical protein [Acidobacteriota bacterium]